jgi:hypothetical protein
MSRYRHLLTAACWLSLQLPAAAQEGPSDTASFPVGSAASATLHDPTGHLAFTAGAGQLGAKPIYALQLAFHPHRRFALEATLAHNPASGVHAALHHFGAQVPVGSLWRLRPFLAAGLGTIQVFAGDAIQADTVTRLALNGGAGAHFFVRNDVALRVEGRSFALLDQQEENRGTLQFTQWSAGVTFYRSLFASVSHDRGETP